MKLLHNLIERYKRYGLKERERRLSLTNRKYRPMSIYPNAPVSPYEEMEGDYEQELNWHNLVMEQASKYPSDKAKLEAINTAARSVCLVLGEIERLRGSAVIAHFSDQSQENAKSDIHIAARDFTRLEVLLHDIPSPVKRLDFIIDSPGGAYEIGKKIVPCLRERFEEVNFLIPHEAFSLASLMAMSANSIILGKNGSLGMYDPLIDDFDGKYAQAYLLMEDALAVIEEMRWRPWRKLGYQGWTARQARTTIKTARHTIQRTRHLAALWLAKYMFGHSEIEINYHDLALEREPIAVKNHPITGDDYRKAERIASFFTDFKSYPNHKEPLLYDEICRLGLNLSQADETLESLMRKAYELNDRTIFERFDLSKMWYSSSDYRFFSPTLSPYYDRSR
jgi:ATP-dependent protease ClpP protease subunit